MIDEKKLIEEIQGRQKYYESKAAEYDEAGERYEYLMDVCNGKATELTATLSIINEQPKVAEWIPCSERLPEEDYDTVLVWLDTKIYDIAIWHHEHGFRPWYAVHFEEATPEWKGKVVAWQPLPEPWEGEAE